MPRLLGLESLASSLVHMRMAAARLHEGGLLGAATLDPSSLLVTPAAAGPQDVGTLPTYPAGTGREHNRVYALPAWPTRLRGDGRRRHYGSRRAS